MSNIWERFEGIATPAEVTEAKAKYSPIEVGDYEAVLEEIAPAETNDGLPKLSAKFRTTSNRVIFYNQNLQNLNSPQMTAVNIANAVAFVSAIIGEDIEFEGLAKFADLISGIAVGGTYRIHVSYATKDTEMKYPKIKVLPPTDGAINTGVDGIDEELPFN